MEQLKSVTAGQHRSLEQRVRIARSDVSLADYRAYLNAMLGFTAPLETRWAELAPAFRARVELDRRRKTDSLRADLEALEPRLGPAPQAECEAVPDTDTEAHALGALYVLEGSTLGARYLLRHLERLDIASASRYLRSYGEELGAMWQKLRAELVAHHARHPESARPMLQAACSTFDLLDAWLVTARAAERSEAA